LFAFRVVERELYKQVWSLVVFLRHSVVSTYSALEVS